MSTTRRMSNGGLVHQMAGDRQVPSWARKARKASLKLGWTWRLSGSNHVQVLDPSGRLVWSLSNSAYEGTVAKKDMAALRKAGCPGA